MLVKEKMPESPYETKEMAAHREAAILSRLDRIGEHLDAMDQRSREFESRVAVQLARIDIDVTKEPSDTRKSLARTAGVGAGAGAGIAALIEIVRSLMLQ